MAMFDPEKDAFIANVLYQEGKENFQSQLQIYYTLSNPPFDLTEEDKKRYYALYGWSNEAISKYYDYKDLTNQSALCVTGSGAHPIHASLAGATKIDAFDRNPLAKWYSALQIALIKTYDFKTYLNQFDSFPISNEGSSIDSMLFLKKNIDLSELSNHLTDDEQRFWKILLNNQVKSTIDLFRTDGYLLPLEKRYAYFSEEAYNKAKQRLNSTTINYFDLDITNPKERQCLSLYSAIFLSNIGEYYFFNKENDQRDILQNCSNLLKEGGILYDYSCVYGPEEFIIPDLKHEETIICTRDKDYNETGVTIYKKERKSGL